MATAIVFVGIYYIFLDWIIGRLKVLNLKFYRGIKYKDVVFVSTGVFFQLYFFDFFLPY